MTAQVDLNSQRAEIQTINSVDGKALNRVFAINPTPQHMEIKGGFITLATENVGAVIAPDAGMKPTSGAYTLSITADSVIIKGYDARGVFYGQQTLRQIREANPDSLPLLEINDFPSLEHRGVVEGFYGTPWSHDVRLSLIDFYGRNKMNTYIYGPKDDPYHSSPNWRKPYPADEARNIKELVDACRRNYVEFVWAIHPGKDIRWDKADYDSLVNKFEMMHSLGVRSFALFFDDIEGEGTNPYKQADLLNRLTENFVKTHPGVADLIVCPTDYSRLWANPGPNGMLAIYGRELNPEIDVMYTGDVVCSDLTKDTMDFFNALIKRPGYYWWNWPVTDYARNHILQGPAYGLDTTLTAADVTALVSNPMEHGEASKLALYGVADYSWNIHGFNSLDNWERGLRELMPQCYDAYRTFAIHSTDTQTGYRRAESWETDIFNPAEPYTPAQWQTLYDEFQRVADAPVIIRQKCGNQLLIKELDPWLTEFELLGRRGLSALELLRDLPGLTPAEVDERLKTVEMTDEQREAYTAHISGTMKLQPFIDAVATYARTAEKHRFTEQGGM